MLSRRGLEFTRDDIERLRLERILPNFLLHDRIRKACIDIFNTGHHQAAVFEAFRELEVAIREAAGYTAEHHGRQMIMDAFNEKSAGPLVDEAAPPSEQEAIRFLMAGSVGWFKNPRSHRRFELERFAEIGRNVDRRKLSHAHGGNARGPPEAGLLRASSLSRCDSHRVTRLLPRRFPAQNWGSVTVHNRLN